jgi:dihydroorotase
VAAVIVFYAPIAHAQAVNILLKGGHVIDPRNGIDAVMDVAITAGRISQVAPDIPIAGAQRVIDVTGLYVTPGLVDMHGHLGPTADPPDGFTFRSGVTTIVDAGTFGWRNFADAQQQIAATQTRVLVFLAIAGNKGSRVGGHGNILVEDLSDYDPVMTAAKARQHRALIVGIKVWKSPDFSGIEKAVEAGRLANIPVMIDFGEETPPLSLEHLLLKVFRPGDIYTHAYAYHPNTREAIVDGAKNYEVRPFVLAARKKGIIFDVGHGGGAFSFQGAVPAMKQGFLPDTISTDLHHNSMNNGMKDMTNVMSKFLNMGMSLQQVIAASTWRPAQVIKRDQLGHLSVGAEADVAVFNLRQGNFGFTDVRNRVLKGTQKLEAELTIRAGRVVWDLNGIGGIPWDREPQAQPGGPVTSYAR